MPAILSVSPPALALVEAGTVAILPAHTEQRVVPSAICAPHILQKAMRVSSSCGWSDGMRPAACRGPPPSHVAARYQKVRGKAIHSSAGPLACGDMPTYQYLRIIRLLIPALQTQATPAAGAQIFCVK